MKLFHVKKALLWPNLFLLIIMFLLVLATQYQGIAVQHQEDLLKLNSGMEKQSDAKSHVMSSSQMVYRRLLSGWKTSMAAEVSGSTSDVESEATIYHLDYSSPKTHPPKNN